MAFHLEGLRVVIVRLHQRVAEISQRLIFETVARVRYEEKELNQRQYGIVRFVLDSGASLSISALRADPRYQAMYASKTDKTRQRDLKNLLGTGLVVLDKAGHLRPSFAADKCPK